MDSDNYPIFTGLFYCYRHNCIILIIKSKLPKKLNIKLPFALHNGQPVDISAVESGLACNCIYSSCGQWLAAKKGDINEHYFAHDNNEECKGAIETALHIYAKKILEKHKRIILPPVYLDHSDKLIFPSAEVIFDKVVLEKRVNNIIPDIIVFIKGNGNRW